MDNYTELGTRFLVRDPMIMGGTLTVLGTRMPVSMVVVYCQKDSYTPETIVEDWGYPKDFIERFREALEWGIRNPEKLN